MRTTHEDKIAAPAAVKLSPRALAAYTRRMAEAALTPEEQHEVGKALALTWEQRVKDDPGRRSRDDASAPTEDELAAIAEAEAAWRAAKDRTVKVRIDAIRLEQQVRREYGSEHDWRSGGNAPDPVNPTTAQIGLAATVRELRRLEAAEAVAADEVIRVRDRMERRRKHIRFRMMARQAGIAS